jgi:hypothetical protein
MQPSASQDVRDPSTVQVVNGMAVLWGGKGTTKERTESQHTDLNSYEMITFNFGIILWVARPHN